MARQNIVFTSLSYRLTISSTRDWHSPLRTRTALPRADELYAIVRIVQPKTAHGAVGGPLSPASTDVLTTIAAAAFFHMYGQSVPLIGRLRAVRSFTSSAISAVFAK